MSCGITSIGLYLPPQIVTASQLSTNTGIPESILINKYGISKKRKARAHETSYYMGLKAAENALRKNNFDAKDLDIVIWVGSQNTDKFMWIAAISIAHELGANGAWAFDMSALCGSMLAGISVAKSFLDSHQEYRNILLVGGCRDADYLDEDNPDTHFLLDLSSGAAAVLISKDSNENIILGDSFKCDGSLSNMCYAARGTNLTHYGSKEKIRFLMRDVETFKSVLKSSSMENFEIVINEALKKSNLKTDDVDYLALLHIKKSAHEELLERIKLKNTKTLYLSNFGHMEQIDPVLSLFLAESEGKIKRGSNIVMVSAGLGFIWGSIVIYYK